jgi:hypothetical protein
MAKPKLTSVLVLGVDLGAPDSGAVDRSIEPIARHLIGEFDRRQFSASWALGSLACQALTLIRSASMPHEITLQWSAPPASGRADSFLLAAGLREQLAAAQRRGIELRSLTADPRIRLPYDVLVRCGFRAVRPIRVRNSPQVVAVQPQSLRFGLWGMPVSCFWPHPRRLAHHFVARNLLHQLRMAAASGAALHVVFDLPTLSSAGEGCLRGLEALLDCVGRLRDEAGLRICRLSDVDRLARLATIAQPAHSILRRVA